MYSVQLKQCDGHWMTPAHILSCLFSIENILFNSSDGQTVSLLLIRWRLYLYAWRVAMMTTTMLRTMMTTMTMTSNAHQAGILWEGVAAAPSPPSITTMPPVSNTNHNNLKNPESLKTLKSLKCFLCRNQNLNPSLLNSELRPPNSVTLFKRDRFLLLEGSQF